MRAYPATLFLVLLAVVTSAFADSSTGEDQARAAALVFGQGLVQAQSSLLAPILPTQGKVRMKLRRLGPEQGAYSARQVEAVLEDFFRQGSVRSYDLLRVECAEERYALAHARARLTDRNGRPAEIDLDLTFQPEGDRWVLREIRETPS